MSRVSERTATSRLAGQCAPKEGWWHCVIGGGPPQPAQGTSELVCRFGFPRGGDQGIRDIAGIAEWRFTPGSAVRTPSPATATVPGDVVWAGARPAVLIDGLLNQLSLETRNILGRGRLGLNPTPLIDVSIFAGTRTQTFRRLERSPGLLGDPTLGFDRVHMLNRRNVLRRGGCARASPAALRGRRLQLRLRGRLRCRAAAADQRHQYQRGQCKSNAPTLCHAIPPLAETRVTERPGADPLKGIGRQARERPSTGRYLVTGSGSCWRASGTAEIR